MTASSEKFVSQEKQESDIAERIREARDLLFQADAVVAGIGAGLSASAGLNYGTEDFLEKIHPEYYKRGVKSVMELMSMYWPTYLTVDTATRFWGVWARHIQQVRYETALTSPYSALASILQTKDSFVITTNADGQVQKMGFDPASIYAPQGNYSFLQCSVPCSEDITFNKDIVYSMVSNMPDALHIRPQDVPHCPRCGALMVPNLRCDSRFVEKPNLENAILYERFLRSYRYEQIVFLELGVGYNTPIIIRYPFETMTRDFPHAHLIRINMSHSNMPAEISGKVVSINADLGTTLRHITLR